jgi:hypothetical protein
MVGGRSVRAGDLTISQPLCTSLGVTVLRAMAGLRNAISAIGGRGLGAHFMVQELTAGEVAQDKSDDT